MKFNYEYHTKDNVRRSGVVLAADRDAAYAQLKSQGIRPSRLTEAPGIVNKLFGKGKRWLAIGFLSTALLAAVVVMVLSPGSADGSSPMPRHQIYGDPARMEEYERSGYAELFAAEGDRFLARFVQPGVLVKLPPSRDIAARRRLAESLTKALDVPDGEAIAVVADDTREASEIKRMVLWLRTELRRYLANGVGTTERYVDRLEERQIKEFQIYTRVESELKATDNQQVWDARNDTLRSLGIKTISKPEKNQNNF